MLIHKVTAGFGAIAIFIAAPVFAQAQAPAPAGTQAPSGAPTPPGGIPVGPLTVFPAVDLAVGHDDNLFLRPTNRSASSFTVLSPSLRAELLSGPNKFGFGLRIDDGRYASSAADHYTDYSFNGSGNMEFSGRTRLALRAEARHGHDPRGSTDRAVAGSPDEYDNTGVGGTFSYGAAGARGRIEIDASAFARRYTNNRASTVVSDHDTTQLGGTFYWRVMPRTELLAQAVHTNFNYTLGASTQDSAENRYLVGVKWEATAKTTGTAKFGIQDKKFDSATRENVPRSSSWDVGVRWSPLSYSVFDLNTAKQTSESTGVGDAVVGETYNALWSHAWSSRLRTQVGANYGISSFTGATGLSRKDQLTSFSLGVAYDFRRWLRFGADISHSERDSNIDTFDFKRNLLRFTVGATL